MSWHHLEEERKHALTAWICSLQPEIQFPTDGRLSALVPFKKRLLTPNFEAVFLSKRVGIQRQKGSRRRQQPPDSTREPLRASSGRAGRASLERLLSAPCLARGTYQSPALGKAWLGRPQGGAGIQRQSQVRTVVCLFFPSQKSTNNSNWQGDGPRHATSPWLCSVGCWAVSKEGGWRRRMTWASKPGTSLPLPVPRRPRSDTLQGPLGHKLGRYSRN